MHTVISFIPLSVWLVLGYAIDRWNKRPAARARWTRLSLHDKIARQVRGFRFAVVFQLGWLALFAGLRVAGWLSPGGWLAGTIAAGIVLAADLYLLHSALAARRAYNNLGPLAYLAEIRHAFGSPS